jgi:hypothetical protein
MNKIILSAFFALFLMPTLAGATAGPSMFYVDGAATGTPDGLTRETAFTTLQPALAAVADGDTINVASGTYDQTSQITLTKAISLIGEGSVTLKAISDFGTTNGSKHLFLVQTGTDVVPVTISNIIFDCDNKCYGFNTYNNAYAVLNNVTVSNSKGAGLTVNGSTIVADNLSTTGNSWGAVNVDPGSGVTTPSIFTLNSGTLGESTQIWSDGDHVDNTATVTVNATGYSQYSVAGAPAYFLWANKALSSGATITRDGTSTVYSTLTAAITDATSTDTVVLNEDLTLTSRLSLSKSLTLDGNGHTLSATFAKTDNSNNSAIGITHDNVIVKNLIIDGTGGTDLHGINVYLSSGVVLDNVTVSNNGHAGIVVNGSTVEATNLTTSGNVWGAVNVDPGSGVTTPSIFTLNSGTLGESTQIWSDGGHVDATSTVTVNAAGYNQYLIAGTTKYFVWANTLGNVAVITKDNVSTLYTTVLAAVKAAVAGDIVKIAPGNYNLVKDDVTSISGQTGWYLPITQNDIKLVGVTSGGQEISSTSGVAANLYSTQETANGSWSTQNLITVFGDNVTIQGLGIMNKIEPNKGIEVLGNNFTATYNVFAPVPTTLFANANNYGGDDITKYGSGVYFNNNDATTTRTGTVTNNLFANSGVTFDSFGSNWTVEVTNNTFDGNKIWKSGGTDYYYSSVGATTWANQPDFTGSTLNIKNNKFINMVTGQPTLKIKSGMTGTFNATENWWGVNSASDISSRITATGSSTVNFSPWFANSEMSTLSSSLTTSTSSVSITFTAESTLTGGAVTAIIPAGTIISGSSTWDGIFNLPTATTTTTLPGELSGSWLSGVSAIEIGGGSTPLTFSAPVKLTFAGQSGKYAGWSQNGVFKEITATCNNATNPTLADGADCKIDVGADLVVWTKHATTFISYTKTSIPYGSGGNSTGGSSAGVVGAVLGVATTSVPGLDVVVSTSTKQGEVLGAVAYSFARNLRFGNSGTDVTELQKMLITGGYLKLSRTTKYFGPLTKSAVIRWQKANKLPTTGYFGPMSRAIVAK